MKTYHWKSFVGDPHLVQADEISFEPGHVSFWKKISADEDELVLSIQNANITEITVDSEYGPIHQHGRDRLNAEIEFRTHPPNLDGPRREGTYWGLVLARHILGGPCAPGECEGHERAFLSERNYLDD
jgi:hypothetical protein